MNFTPRHCPVCHPHLFVSSRPAPCPGRTQPLDHVWGRGLGVGGGEGWHHLLTWPVFLFYILSFPFRLPKQTWLPPRRGISGEEDGVPVPVASP